MELEDFIRKAAETYQGIKAVSPLDVMKRVDFNYEVRESLRTMTADKHEYMEAVGAYHKLIRGD